MGGGGGAGGIAEGMGGIGPAGKSAGNVGRIQPGGVGRWWTKERLQFGQDYLKKELGLNDMQARAALARFAAVESPNKGADEGGGGFRGRAQGIGQWLGSRRHGYEVGNFESQLAKVAREMKGGEPGAGPLEQRAYARLKEARTPQEAAEAMEDFERATSPTVSRASLIRKTMAGQAGIDQILSGENRGQGPTVSNADRMAATERAMKEAEAEGAKVTSGYRSPDHPLSRANPRSAHSQGLAFDLRAKTEEQADATIAAQRARFERLGMKEGEHFKIKDEVRNPAPWATAKHVHVQLTPAGAELMNSLKGETPEGVSGGRGSSNVIQMNVDRVRGNAPDGQAPSPLSSGPVSNDNSRSVSQSNQFNTTINASDPDQANSAYKRAHEQLAGMSINNLRTVVR